MFYHFWDKNMVKQNRGIFIHGYQMMSILLNA